MFRRRHIHSSECSHCVLYIFLNFLKKLKYSLKLKLNMSGNPTGRSTSFPEMKCWECVLTEMICEMSWRMCANKVSFTFKRDQSWCFGGGGLLLCDQVPLNRGINYGELLYLQFIIIFVWCKTFDRKNNRFERQNRSTQGCSKLKRSVDMTSSGKNGLNIRTNASPKWDRTRCPEE